MLTILNWGKVKKKINPNSNTARVSRAIEAFFFFFKKKDSILYINI